MVKTQRTRSGCRNIRLNKSSTACRLASTSTLLRWKECLNPRTTQPSPSMSKGRASFRSAERARLPAFISWETSRQRPVMAATRSAEGRGVFWSVFGGKVAVAGEAAGAGVTLRAGVSLLGGWAGCTREPSSVGGAGAVGGRVASTKASSRGSCGCQPAWRSWATWLNSRTAATRRSGSSRRASSVKRGRSSLVGSLQDSPAPKRIRSRPRKKSASWRASCRGSAPPSTARWMVRRPPLRSPSVQLWANACTTSRRSAPNISRTLSAVTTLPVVN